MLESIHCASWNKLQLKWVVLDCLAVGSLSGTKKNWCLSLLHKLISINFTCISSRNHLLILTPVNIMTVPLNLFFTVRATIACLFPFITIISIMQEKKTFIFLGDHSNNCNILELTWDFQTFYTFNTKWFTNTEMEKAKQEGSERFLLVIFLAIENF